MRKNFLYTHYFIFLILSSCISLWAREEIREIISIDSVPHCVPSPVLNIPPLPMKASPKIGVNKGRRTSVIGEFMKNPKEIGTLASSSPSLSIKMTKDVKSENTCDIDIPFKILELGPGLGPFTKQMVKQGVDQKQLTLVESHRGFCEILRENFPQATILEGFAQDILNALAYHGRFNVIISGIPLKNISNREQRKSLFTTIFNCLKDGCYLRQFTYGWKSPIKRQEIKEIEQLLNCKITKKSNGWVRTNFPWAKVYTYTLVRLSAVTINNEEADRVRQILNNVQQNVILG